MTVSRKPLILYGKIMAILVLGLEYLIKAFSASLYEPTPGVRRRCLGRVLVDLGKEYLGDEVIVFERAKRGSSGWALGSVSVFFFCFSGIFGFIQARVLLFHFVSFE